MQGLSLLAARGLPSKVTSLNCDIIIYLCIYFGTKKNIMTFNVPDNTYLHTKSCLVNPSTSFWVNLEVGFPVETFQKIIQGTANSTLQHQKI